MRRRAVLFAALALLAGACSKGSKDGDKAGPTTTVAGGPSTTVATAPSPLTGLPMPADAAGRPLLVVKIDNDEPKARPQAGLAEADVVYEELVEGGATRFAALYHSTDAGLVGPVRSARSTDVNLATSFDRPLFAYSGASSVFRALLRRAVFVDVGVDRVPAAYTTRPEYPAPSNLFSSTKALFDGAASQGTAPASLWQFGPVGAGDAPARELIAAFPGPSATKIAWEWNESLKQWMRKQSGTPHMDHRGHQIGAANVIVQFTEYKDSGIRDRSSAPVPEGRLVGKGEAWFFVDGKIIRGAWEKPSLTAPTQYLDGAGAPVVLSLGRTWVELLPPGSASAR